MVTIEYCEDGRPISDFECDKWLNVVRNVDDATFRISTSLPFDFIRLAIVKGVLDYKNITFLYNGVSFQANEYGAIEHWPHGFCDMDMTISGEILRTAMKKKKEKLIKGELK